jgi:predicted enzyme related to lactoylglutathione lyase
LAIPGTGYAYWTITVNNLDETISSCESGGYKVTVPALEIQAGVPITMLDDPDGNWVEFLQMDQ